MYWFSLKSGTGVPPVIHAQDARATSNYTSTRSKQLLQVTLARDKSRRLREEQIE